MFIGHIRLITDFDGGAHQLLRLALSLAERNVRQHAVVACPTLAARLEANAHINVTRCANSPMDAYCAFAACDLAHAHDAVAAKTALLLKLTTAQPYVLSHLGDSPSARDAIVRSAYRRAAGIVCRHDDHALTTRSAFPDVPTHVVQDRAVAACQPSAAAARDVAADYLRIYRSVIDTGSVPNLLI